MDRSPHEKARIMDLSLAVSSGGPTVRGAILRSNQAYLELLGPKTTLQWGIAFCCEAFPRLAAGNQFREVWVESPEEAARAIEAAKSFFAEQGVTCSRWALAEAQKPEPLHDALLAAGFEREESLAMALTAWPERRLEHHLRILPARPMRAAYEEAWREVAKSEQPDQREVTVEAALERLDDHRIDAFVAMAGDKPAGICAMFQVGDVGRIMDIHVLREHQRARVGGALLDHMVQIARRLLHRVVCVQIAEDNDGGIAFLSKSGFVECGRLIEYRNRALTG